LYRGLVHSTIHLLDSADKRVRCKLLRSRDVADEKHNLQDNVLEKAPEDNTLDNQKLAERIVHNPLEVAW
jgi:hypothetical protein